jgi:DNA-directed RNA polymerase subunit RPC12/RpoP
MEYTCIQCGHTWKSQSKYPPKKCPNRECQSKKWRGPKRREYTCIQCGHTWKSQSKYPPKKCPNRECQSRKWRGPKRREYTCIQCGHTWKSQSKYPPKECPKTGCRSKKWRGLREVDQKHLHYIELCERYNLPEFDIMCSDDDFLLKACQYGQELLKKVTSVNSRIEDNDRVFIKVYVIGGIFDVLTQDESRGEVFLSG